MDVRNIWADAGEAGEKLLEKDEGKEAMKVDQRVQDRTVATFRGEDDGRMMMMMTGEFIQVRFSQSHDQPSSF